MTISRQPWTLKQEGFQTSILDADGKYIGLFYDWQNAELILKQQEELEQSKLKLEEAVDRIEELDEEIKELKELTKGGDNPDNE